MMSIFQQIRDACERVSHMSSWVTIDLEAALLYPEKLELSAAAGLTHSEEEHLLDAGEDTLRFFVLLDSINFGSGYFPYLEKGVGLSGYFTVASRLKAYVLRHGIPTPSELITMNMEACASIFGQSLENNHARELMALFSLAWRELGQWALDHFSGDYLGFLRSSKTANEAVNALCLMRPYQDISRYYDIDVPLLKRAQILIQDMDIACPGHNLLRFPDIDRLTIFADNVIPYVFCADGLLKMNPWLENRIQNEELIAHGSVEEIELRACSVYLADIICGVINSELMPLSVRRLDFLLWNRGQSLKKQSSRKRHRSRCIYY